jgi:hypothetical protein
MSELTNFQVDMLVLLAFAGGLILGLAIGYTSERS